VPNQAILLPERRMPIRAATSADAAAIARVIRKAFAQYRGILEPPSGALGMDRDAVRELMRDGGFMVTEVRRRIVACVYHHPQEDYVYLGRLAVLPAYRGHGLGAGLVAAVEESALRAGRERVRLGVRVSLPENRVFFEGLGYRQVGLEAHPGFDEPTFAWLEKQL
jgi:predicted N-acetyltransferase YhbS